MEHQKEIPEFRKLLERVLRPGGIFIASQAGVINELGNQAFEKLDFI